MQSYEIGLLTSYAHCDFFQKKKPGAGPGSFFGLCLVLVKEES